MALPKAYSTFQDFEREEIRPGMRIGWSVHDIHNPHDAEVEFDLDPFEAALMAAELEEEEEYEDE